MCLKAPHLSRKYYISSVSKVITSKNLDYQVNIVLIRLSADYISLLAILI